MGQSIAVDQPGQTLHASRVECKWVREGLSTTTTTAATTTAATTAADTTIAKI